MKKFYLILILSVLILGACGSGPKEDHFITDAEYRQIVETQFTKQKQLAQHRAKQLFGVLDEKITLKEQEALKFLFAFMPLSDLADYDGQFFLAQVRKAFEARETFSWGKKIPEELFRHFVLPYRVNNENLDDFRSRYFDELKKRVVNLPMREAVLEVNHWCHEKVAYKAGDIRTSGPCSTIRTAYGRCGEESTLTVTALRTAGIPARQCYTPRWAHCDDNHAWVEAWVDGKWYYLGACEPEPELDMAWFTEPARRAMIVHTKVFGQYTGPEEAVKKTDQFTEINVINNYAQTQKLSIKVIDNNQKPVEDATVGFRLYNYAEFYPLVKKKTGKDGMCSLTIGLGDLLVWANKGAQYGFKKVSAAGTDAVTIVLDKDPKKEYVLDLDMTPPVTREPWKVPEEGKKKNDLRLKEEDRIRGEYEKTFYTGEKARHLAKEYDLDPGETWKYFQKSRGNWRALQDFLAAAAPGSNPNKKWILPLLSTVSDKDLRDTPAKVLLDHFLFSAKYSRDLDKTQPDLYKQYILAPRVRNELLVEYKQYFHKAFDPAFIKNVHEDPFKLVKWVGDNIQIDEKSNYYRLPLTPRGVYELRVANSISRDIFFVSLCRSFGVPARLEPGFLTPQFFHIQQNKWMDAPFEAPTETPERKKGYVTLKYRQKDEKLIPAYYPHFTLARFEEGVYNTLDYDFDKKVTQFPEKLELNTGHYLLVTGSRLSDGTVLSRLRFFNVPENQAVEIPLELRKIHTKSVVYGKMPMDKTTAFTGMSGEKGLIIGWIDPGKEPTKHVMRELGRLKEEFDKWGGGFVFFIVAEKTGASFDPKSFSPLPSRHVFSLDKGNARLTEFKEIVSKSGSAAPGNNYPIFAAVKPNGEIFLLTQGYRIGIGELLLRSVH